MAKITKQFVDRLKGSTANAVYWDDLMQRFGLRVKASGSQAYVIQYRNAAGQSRRVTIGKVGILTPEEARKQARSLLADVAKGKDPAAEKHAIRADLTVAEVVERYLEQGPAAKPEKKQSSWRTDESNLRRHVVPLLGGKKLASLSRTDIQKFQRDVTEGKTKAEVTGAKKRGRIRVMGGPGTAWRATAVLGAMLAWAQEQGLRSDNPATGVKLNKLNKHERFLTEVEVGRLGDAMAKLEREGINPDSLAIIRLLLLTGARRSEISSLKWRHVDFQRSALLLPDSKTGRKVLPLGAPALEVLSKRSRDCDDDWVFPASRGKSHQVGVNAVWRTVRKAADLEDVRLHDLRHSFASVAVAMNQSLFIVGKVLGHTRTQTTERYSHLALDPVQAAADATSRRLENALNGTASAQVVPLRSDAA